MWNCLDNYRAWLESEPRSLDFSHGMETAALTDAVTAILADGTKSAERVHSEAIAYILENAPIAFPPHSVFFDTVAHQNLLRNFQYERLVQINHLAAEALGMTFSSCLPEGQQTAGLDYGHIAPDWQFLMENGFVGVIHRLETARACAASECAEYYENALRVYRALLSLLDRASRAAEQIGTENALFIAKNLRALCEHAPKTLGEGMQLSLLFHHLLMNFDCVGCRSLGALDRLFAPLYESDLSHGKHTEAQLRTLTRYFFLQISGMKTVANLPFAIGGIDQEERDATTPYTYVMLDEYAALNIYDPKIHVLYHKNTPARLTKRILSLIREGKSSFVFVNVEASRDALHRIGISPADSRRLAVYGCYEPAAEGTEIPCTCASYVNLAKALELVLLEKKDYDSFDALLDAVKENISRFVARSMDFISESEKRNSLVGGAPLLSATYESSALRGVDVYAGGAKYNNTSIVGAGIATLTDSLLALREMVYEKKMLSLAGLRDVLASDFQGEEKLRQYAIKKCKKYGCGDKDADTLAAMLVSHFADAINGKPNARGGVFRAGLFSVDLRFRLGKGTGATPDGRHAYAPLSKNAIASVGCDREGATALLRSVQALPAYALPDGCVADIVLHESAVRAEAGLAAFEGLLLSHCKAGGNSVHFNVLSADTLRAAQREPDKYRNLQIRLCGWNVHFNDLSRAEQDEFILQAENA